VILGLVFGGLNILCSVISCIIMLKATLKMKELAKKNNFDASQFQDIRMNLLVSMLICIGYVLDYLVSCIIVILYIEDVISSAQETIIAIVNKLTLSIFIFAAYIILMKIFLTY